MTRPDVKILLDEHYPGWLAEELRADGIDADAVVERIDLRGADDTSVLRTATAEGRLVVTEDVTTFGVAMASIDPHAGVIFCHHARFPRTRSGLERLRLSLVAFAVDPPAHSSQPSFVWWLSP